MHTYGYYGFSNISWIPHCLHDWFQLELALFPDSGPYVDTRVRIETLFAGESLVSRWHSQLIIDLNLWRLFPLPWLRTSICMHYVLYVMWCALTWCDAMWSDVCIYCICINHISKHASKNVQFMGALWFRYFRHFCVSLHMFVATSDAEPES